MYFIFSYLFNHTRYVLTAVLLGLFSCTQTQGELYLDGTWQFQEDPADVGLSENWSQKSLNDSIQLPGSMAENDKGEEITVDTKWTGTIWDDSVWYKDEKMRAYRQPGNVKASFWLSPRKVYCGPAWYRKEVKIPFDWEGDRVTLFLERPHWETIVWVDDQKVGMQNTLGTPHKYDLTNYIKPGRHVLTIRVDNRVKDINVGLDAHSISDNTQTNWNGIVGKIKLIRSPRISLSNVQVYPDVEKARLLIKAGLYNSEVSSGNYLVKAFVTVNDTGKSLGTVKKEINGKDSEILQLIYPMGDNPLLWDEFSPNLYTLTLQLITDFGISERKVTFGMRDFQVDGKRFSINGRPVFLRGTLECAIFPLTGYPPTTVDDWKNILSTIQDHGLNHVRFHSWCPPEAAFQAADELGVYLQIEASVWTRIGDGAPIDKWIYKEAENIIADYGNHPSFVMMAYGNEPAGKHQNDYLRDFVDHMKDLDNRRLYTGGTGWPLLENMDYYIHQGPRIQRWALELNSVINAEPPQTMFDYDELIQKISMPYVSHEMGQWCVYPNFKEMSKYTGVLQPKNFEIFKETLEKNKMGHLADSFHMASGKLQALCYKADIEAALRTKDMAGFQLLDLHDFPGQGTALVGILDPFWDSKKYITPEEFRQFSDVTVPLARLPKRIYANDEVLTAGVEVAHYGQKALFQVATSWKLSDGAGLVASGSIEPIDIPVGNGTELGEIKVGLDQILEPKKLKLEVKVANDINTWDVWVYPSEKKQVVAKNSYKVVEQLDDDIMSYLREGGSVLLNISKGDIRLDKGGDIGVGFSSIFWNTSWTRGQKPHTLGILCNPDHPALEAFPTAYHSNWQWWDAMSHSNAIVLDDFSPELVPIVRIIDDWFENRRTALIFEAKVGNGKLLFSGIDLHSNLENRLEAQQLRYSLEKYVGSDLFNPGIELSEEQVLSLLIED